MATTLAPYSDPTEPPTYYSPAPNANDSDEETILPEHENYYRDYSKSLYRDVEESVDGVAYSSVPNFYESTTSELYSGIASKPQHLNQTASQSRNGYDFSPAYKNNSYDGRSSNGSADHTENPPQMDGSREQVSYVEQYRRFYRE